jgi:predicted metalloendopeptidase
MTAETKKRALEKLHALNKNKIGYPDTWRDYSSVRVARNEYLENVRRASRFEVDDNYNDLGKPVDRTRWRMTPPTVKRLLTRRSSQKLCSRLAFSSRHSSTPLWTTP